MENKSTVFIIGTGRSGTHLLSQVLDGNSVINFPMEQTFVLKTYRKFYNRPLTQDAKDLFKAQLKKDKFLEHFWKPDTEKLFKHIDLLPENTSYYELCNVVTSYRQSVYGSKQNAEIIGYHNPQLTFHAENLMKAFPGSKFIFLHRNALDNVSSFKNSKFFRGTISIPFFAFRWKWYNRYGLKLCKKYPDRLYRLCYEEMVNDPQKKIKEVCAFLGAEYSDDMLQFEEKFKPFYKETMPAENYHVHVKLTEKINSKNIGSFSKNLDPADIDLVRHITNKTGGQLGYAAEPYKFRIGFLFAVFEAAYYMYKFDYYAVLQSMVNKVLPNNKMIRFR